MRIIVFFDLPVVNIEDRREYTGFRKYLLKNGFVMMQESVYSKLVLNAVAAKSVIQNIRANSPDKGLVELLMVTEKQFNNIEYVVGAGKNEVINSTERLIEL